MKKFRIKSPDATWRDAIREKIDDLNKPKGSLGRLESLALQICLIEQKQQPTLHHPCHLLFGADHGIEKEGVSVSPREITWQQMINFTKGGGGVNMFCRQHGFKLSIVDVGVDHDLSAYPDIINRKIARGTAALFSADKTKLFCCRGLHTHAGDINSHDIGKALPHLGDIRSQLRSLESDGDIHIGNAPAFRADHGHDLGQQNLAVNPLPFRGSVREKMSDVAKGKRTEQGIT